MPRDCERNVVDRGLELVEVEVLELQRVGDDDFSPSDSVGAVGHLGSVQDQKRPEQLLRPVLRGKSMTLTRNAHEGPRDWKTRFPPIELRLTRSRHRLPVRDPPSARERLDVLRALHCAKVSRKTACGECGGGDAPSWNRHAWRGTNRDGCTDPTKLPDTSRSSWTATAAGRAARAAPRRGSREGAKGVRDVVRAARQSGCEALTLYAFSAQNWQRPADEVGGADAAAARLPRRGARTRSWTTTSA